ncbi:hypothetical protein PGT21_033815 [Puccinia graminis f. sp. tritici]|uniref:Uncharacterized protein n=1 Tax=Puccinia graminis f. sp. tritici TaxID=56615 RepID=A0A5B0N7I6_PUCGR|nr:hypothetical protein PGTUg99_009885 [Puccinia graminis f. sp. tritici]KAA1084666.1 hypothetical protein PGT21_033815 [Puccinia graminis f. sp. tritici]
MNVTWIYLNFRPLTAVIQKRSQRGSLDRYIDTTMDIESGELFLTLDRLANDIHLKLGASSGKKVSPVNSG